MAETSCSEAHPIENVQSLLAWKQYDLSAKLKECIAKIPNLTLRNASSTFERPQTLVCHDMKGGYIEDRFLDGCSDDQAYRLLQWPVVDWFVYFSHKFVTIPPPGWISAAHTNGVPVLGTIITESDDGKVLCSELFSTEEKVNAAVEQLISIASTYKLHGWLVNIENELPACEVPFLKHFCSALTEGMRKSTAGSMVIWYDSVTIEGKLSWQDEVNGQNAEFFSRCDAIFLNYSWTEEKLKKSAEYSMNMKDKANFQRNVFVGIDVFGRNFYEGGGFNTFKALEVIRKYDLSAAIFAPGWSLETKRDEDSFVTRDFALWQPMSPHLYPHGPMAWPLHTTFGEGRGTARYEHGEVVSTCPWYDLATTCLLPQLDGNTCRLREDVVWCGGSSLCLTPLAGAAVV